MSNHTFRYSHLMHLSDAALERHLVEKGKRPIEADIIRKAVREYKAAKRAEQSRKTYLDIRWRELIAPLTNEQRVVYSMKRYNKDRYPSRLRKEALDAYEAVLAKLKEKLRRYHKAYKLAPADKAKELGLPNEGEHWVDWVPDHIRIAVTQAFEDIPPVYRARVKTPFERVIPKTLNSLRKTKVLRQIQRDRLKTEQELNIMREMSQGDVTEEQREAEDFLYQLELAENFVLAMPDTVIVPDTWQEALQEEGRNPIKPMTRKKQS